MQLSGVKSLCDALVVNSSLESLNIGGKFYCNSSILLVGDDYDDYWNVVGDDGAKCLSDALKKNSTLQSLDIESNPRQIIFM